MRLWHELLIPGLPRAQLLGQHRECCALRGLGWGRRHQTVDYVFTHPYEFLVAYHYQVMNEMVNRGYRVDPRWWDCSYRGQRAPARPCDPGQMPGQHPVYPEHDASYESLCQELLAQRVSKA